jgi:hypothetical protein
MGFAGKRLYVHRVMWALVTGAWPVADIDHINGDRTDNRIANLREASRAQNLQNTLNRAPGMSGIKGVTFDRQTGKWRPQLKKNGKSINLGRFESCEQAQAAYIAAKRQHHEFCTV